jgi:hypothetical protein
MRTLYGEDSKEYAKAVRKKVKLEQGAADEVRKTQEIRVGANRELGSRMLDYERNALRFRRELGLISAELEIEGQRALEQRQYELMLEALRLREELAGADRVQQEQLRVERELLEQEHQGGLLDLDRARIRASVEEQNRLVDTVASTFTSIANSLLQGTMTFRATLLRIVDTMVGVFVDIGVRMVAHWIKRQLLMTSTT